jgi:hypothetical protein
VPFPRGQAVGVPSCPLLYQLVDQGSVILNLGDTLASCVTQPGSLVEAECLPLSEMQLDPNAIQFVSDGT